MSVRLGIILETYANTWLPCLFLLLMAGAVASAVCRLELRWLDRPVSARAVFWACLIPGMLLLAVCLTLIDKPHFDYSFEALDWMFMFSAFLGIPLVLPFLAGACFAAAHWQQRSPVNLLPMSLLMLCMFALGCAMSNVHDVVWCGAATRWYAERHVAGFDLDLFVAVGECFGISRKVLADYATLGPCAVVMIASELIVAVACFARLRKLRNGGESE